MHSRSARGLLFFSNIKPIWRELINWYLCFWRQPHHSIIERERYIVIVIVIVNNSKPQVTMTKKKGVILHLWELCIGQFRKKAWCPEIRHKHQLKVARTMIRNPVTKASRLSIGISLKLIYHGWRKQVKKEKTNHTRKTDATTPVISSLARLRFRLVEVAS